MIFEKKTKTIQDLEIRLENWKYFSKEKKKIRTNKRETAE